MVEEIAGLASRIGRRLKKRQWTISVAESCTGGLLGDKLTNVSGSSAVFAGGVIAYSYEAKASVLSVPWPMLNEYGAVSREVAVAMAQGVRNLLKTDLGISITGIAGPGGGMPEKPVGLVHLALADAKDVNHRWFVWDSDRVGNKQRSAQGAIDLLIDYLTELPLANTAQGLEKEPVQVSATTHGAALRPSELQWRGQTWVVVSVGRQWVADTDNLRHILVELHDGTRLELTVDAALNWYVQRTWPPQMMA